MYFTHSIAETIKSRVMRYVGQLTSLLSFVWKTFWEEVV